MEKDIILKICGNYPENFSPASVESNPNYVFQNDITYSPVQLFDADQNTVFVNSFLECEHYVSGGWDYLPYESKESFYYETISILLVSGIIIYSLYKKYKLNNINE
ncbi:MAG: hypothetical protein CBD98_001130 [Flavobacteriaceae bacterium TMED238]|nr:hypothetical protein [Pelagibacterales bacterium]RPG63216.1 MAG: hypothetical protein CBD98_001130 [Flavobacteriaceae bacterium TMED238]|tara:strand:+ start:788 stop:1105 length:318 start_codon:yes stop_codon:yes gene_type:complete